MLEKIDLNIIYNIYGFLKFYLMEKLLFNIIPIWAKLCYNSNNSNK